MDVAAEGNPTQPGKQCPFCAKIARGEVTHSGESAVAFPDGYPLTQGHTLVVPRRHEPDYLALTDQEATELWRLARVVCRELQEREGADGFNIGINVGRAAGQTVAHVHLHVIPRYEGDTDDPRGGVRWIVPSKARYWESGANDVRRAPAEAPANALLVRIGADQTAAGGDWNGPVDRLTREFVYVPITERREVHAGLENPYTMLEPSLGRFGLDLPARLRDGLMHLDPDFEQLTYGDKNQRAIQLQANLGRGDLIVFYSGLADVRRTARLVYALVGVLVVDEIVPASSVLRDQWHINAHCRRVLPADCTDVIVRGRAGCSGRLERCLPIGEWRDRAYRVRRGLLDEWGGLSVRDGYLQRSARLPRFLEPERFLAWFERQNPTLIRQNNP